LSYRYIVVVVFNATDFFYGIPTVLLQACCVEEACCYGFLRAAARAWISKASMPGFLDTILVCNNPEVSAQVSTLASQDVIVKSLPMCWDTRRARTKEGYFEFQHFSFFAHLNLRYIFVLAIANSYL
jgi:hypothetical protein